MPEEEEQEEIAVVDRVYEIAGVKRGETLPCQSSIGGYTIVYYSKRADPFCGKCASKHTDDCDPISYAGSYDEGPDLECSECGNKIESSYGDPEVEEEEEPKAFSRSSGTKRLKLLLKLYKSAAYDPDHTSSGQAGSYFFYQDLVDEADPTIMYLEHDRR